MQEEEKEIEENSPAHFGSLTYKRINRLFSMIDQAIIEKDLDFMYDILNAVSIILFPKIAPLLKNKSIKTKREGYEKEFNNISNLLAKWNCAKLRSDKLSKVVAIQNYIIIKDLLFKLYKKLNDDTNRIGMLYSKATEENLTTENLLIEDITEEIFTIKKPKKRKSRSRKKKTKKKKGNKETGMDRLKEALIT